MSDPSRNGPRQHGITIGSLPVGATNALTDVPGIRVGHVTLSDGPIQTGCTAIHLHPGHPFRDKLAAGIEVLNGFGKSIGFPQIAELGTLETPVVLTNTLSVGTAATALVRHMLDRTPEIGETTGTVNPVVMECNDGGWLNDIRGLHVTEDHVRQALDAAQPRFQIGNRGAGTGMSCHGLAGGIGTASRIVRIAGVDRTLGVLTLCNMGRLSDLRIDGRPVGPEIAARIKAQKAAETGSIIVLIATDAPLDARQLRRVAVRAGAGIARVGSHFGSGSGDIALAVSTAETVPHTAPKSAVLSRSVLHEDKIDPLFRAVIEATEEAILSALFAAEPRTGKHGNHRHALSEFLDVL
jgi:D-aminopeptidase